MTFHAGDIVTLKSGGQALTVAAIHDEDATCIWLGEEGDLFREQIPLIALEAILDPEDEEEEEGEGESEDEDSDDKE